MLAAMPAVSAIARHFGSRIDVLSTPYAAPIIEGQAAVGEILRDDEHESANELGDRLRARHYTHAVVFWSNPRIAKALQRAGIETRVGQARRLYSFRYTKRVPIRTESGDVTSHWTDVQMDYARALGASPQASDYRVEIAVTGADEGQAAALVDRTALGQPFVIFHAARGVTARSSHWPSEHFALIADALASAFEAPVLLTGGSDEVSLVAAIAAPLGKRAFCVAGQTTLRSFAALARRARVVVALDSGPMHIAAAAGAPTVGIFALRTDLPHRWRPLGPHVAVIGPDYPCPIWCRKETCRTFACYAALSPDKIVAVAQALVDQPSQAVR